jgi:mono/diheme cytochrome c family protein
MHRQLILLILTALSTLPNIASADEHDEAKMSRGEMLYRNHCIECHNQQIHWRDARIAKDIQSLRVQVDRWQDAIGMHWTPEEINDVSRYLNSTYYFY